MDEKTRKKHVEIIRETIELLEELVIKISDESKSLQHQHELQWQRRYLAHLDGGGETIRGSDYWAQHHEHNLTIKHLLDNVGVIDEELLFLWCVSCDTHVEVHDREGLSGGTPNRTTYSIYKEHLDHTITIRRDETPDQRGVAIYGFDIGVDCATCGADREGGYAIFSGEVSDWFDEVWNG